MDKKVSFTSSVAHSTPPYLSTSISWGLPTKSNGVTESLSLKVVDARPERLINTKNISFQDQDSSSTLSSAQSSNDVTSSGDDNPSRQISFLAHSDVCKGFEETQRKRFAIKSGSSTAGIADIHSSPSKVPVYLLRVTISSTCDCLLTSCVILWFQANFSFHYADPHFGGLMPAAYLPQATVSISSLITYGEENIYAKPHFYLRWTCYVTLCSEVVTYTAIERNAILKW
jgi:nuclear transcription factor Y alpha